MELVPVFGVPAVLPAHRPTSVTEREPQDDGTDEDVLDRSLELPGPARGNDYSTPARPPAKEGHGHLAAYQQETDPEWNAPPDRDVVEIVPRPGDPIDRDQHGKQEQFVGNRIEHLAEIGDFVPTSREVSVEDVAHRRHDEYDEGDELGPIALDEGQKSDDRREADADESDDVGQRPHGGRLP